MDLKLKISSDCYLQFKKMKYSKNGYFDTKLSLFYDEREVEIAKGRFDEEMGSLFFFRINQINIYDGADFDRDFENCTNNIDNQIDDFYKLYSIINGKKLLFMYKDSKGVIYLRIISVKVLKDFSEKVKKSKCFRLSDDVFYEWKNNITESFKEARKRILETGYNSVSKEDLDNDLRLWIEWYK